MKKHFITLFFVAVAAACTYNQSSIEVALALAGENRPELEKTLDYYSRNPADSLKLRAARFLITNMPGHWSLASDALQDYYNDIDTVLNSEAAWQEKVELLNQISLKYWHIVSTQVEDVRVITSDYLIQNIERAFDVWHNEPWARHVQFDDFCEYLLPYKVAEGQPFDSWRDSLKEKYGEDLNLLKYNEHYRHATMKAATTIRANFLEQMNPVYTDTYTGLPLLAWHNLTKLQAGTCDEFTQMMLAVMRSKGVPVVTDIVPQWPSRGGGGGHAWNVLCNEMRKNVAFDASNDTPVGSQIRPDSKFGKVYRQTYAINRELIYMKSKEPVPDFFQNVFLRDVTSEYVPSVSLILDIHPEMKTGNKYAYLSVFDDQDWQPIAYGHVRKNRIQFNDISMDIVYLPVSYPSMELKPLNWPFVLEYSGRVKYFIPDTSRLRSVTLFRKYPVFNRVYIGTMMSVGGKIQASETNDFARPVTIHTVLEWKAAETIPVSADFPAYRYWRFVGPENGYCSIAELMFFRPNDSLPFQGQPMDVERMNKNNSAYKKEKAFDNDPLTYCLSLLADEPAWVGVDFGLPVQFEKIILLPRGDDNNIRIGDEYELLYWGREGWQSLGRQKAKDIELQFDRVPENALLLLHDHTRGKEERIFTYENGEQVWW